MPNWKLPLVKLVERGLPYLLTPDPADAPGAFAVRLAGERPGSVQLPGGDHVIAFGNACTHMGCILVSKNPATFDYQPPQEGRPERLVCRPCPCHGTTFDLTREGIVVQGPATQRLPQLAVRINGELLQAEAWLGEIDPRAESWPF